MRTYEDASHSASSGQELTVREQLSLALDGVLPDADARAMAAYRAAMLLDSHLFAPVLDRLREFSSSAITILAGPFDPFHDLLSILDVQHTIVDDPADITVAERILILGCSAQTQLIDDALDDVRDRQLLVLTSDKSARLSAMSTFLRPGPPSRTHLARLRWNPNIVDVRGSELLAGVRLAPGHVPVAVRRSMPNVSVLAVDALTHMPLMVTGRNGCHTFVHSVAHWWQCDPLGRSALDVRLLCDIHGLSDIGAAFPTVRYGELQAARAMLRGMLLGIDHVLSLE